MYRVDIIESERGWGSRVEDSKYFDNEAEAKKYVKKYNDQYNPDMGKAKTAPDWYMIAQYVGKV